MEKNVREYVIIDGLYYEWDAVVSIMHDGVREDVHNEIALCTNEQFFERYCEAHEEKFGEDFCDALVENIGGLDKEDFFHSYDN